MEPDAIPPPPPRRGVVLFATLALPAVALSSLLLVAAITPRGRFAALCALTLWSLPFFARWRRVAALVAGAVFALLFVGLALAAPSGVAAPDASVRAVYLFGDGASRLAPTNLVPEGDQLVLATHLVWTLDPVMTRASAARLRGAIRAVYDGVESDPAFRALGTAMGDAITDRDTGRLYVFEPSHTPGERRPAVVFLHGSGGSWKGYFYELAALARGRRMGVVQPSFGFGDWHRDGGVAAIERARQWAVSQPWVDPSRVYLACLSNGGRGVTRVMRAGPARYAGEVFVSAVIEPQVLDAAALDPSWRTVPVLAVHGGRDERIPPSYLDDGVAALRDQRLTVTQTMFPDEDHYLIFTARDALRAAVDQWLDGVEGAR